MSVETTKWDAAEYLDSDEAVAAYLSEILGTGDDQHIVQALNTVARARGMTAIARDAGIARQALYKSLGKKGNPRLSTLLGVMKSLGLNLSVRANPS